MLFKLAFRNIIAKPVRAIATVVAIAAAVAMIFAMLSFKPAVRDYMYAVDTAISGGFEIRISTSSSSDRLTAVSGLMNADGKPAIEGVERAVPSLKLFATVGDEYVQVRGFARGDSASAADDIQALQKIEIYDGALEGMRSDDVVISRAAAKHFCVGVGDPLKLALGGNSKTVYIKAIARDSGYFLADSPYLVLGFSSGISDLILSAGVEMCNEIYVKISAGANADEVIERIKGVPQYSALLVGRAVDAGKVEESATSLTAPVVLAGAAVMLLSVCIVVLLFLMGEKEKLSLISSLTVIGAEKRQIALAFLAEGLILAAAGALIGAGLAVGVFVGILKLTLSLSARFAISAWRLLGAMAIGFVAAAGSSLLPTARAFGHTVRENMLASGKKSKLSVILPIFALLAAIVLLSLSLALREMSATTEAWLGIALIVSLLLALATGMPLLVKLTGAALSRTSSPSVKTSGYRLAREKRPARSAAVLGVGMAISMLLFMSWSLTTSIFSSYLEDFEDMAIVSNVRADVDVAEFTSVDGVEGAVKLVWAQGTLSSPKLERSVRILGSADVLDLTDFAFVTDEATSRARLDGEGDFVLVDAAFCKLYGIAEGDMLDLTLNEKTRPVTVGGVLSHRLFNGAYVVISDVALNRLFGASPDTVLVTASGDIKETVGALGEKFSSRNYYAIEALEAFKWDMRTVTSVFDLIGTLAFTVAAFILASSVANTLVGRAGEDKSRRAMLSAGMSKDMLLASELAEHGICALLSYAAAFVCSLPMTLGLIAALNLFGLSFEFMFEAWVVATVGAVMGIMYALVPVALGFNRGYTLKKS